VHVYHYVSIAKNILVNSINVAGILNMEVSFMGNDIEAIRADHLNFLDKTEDEVKEVPATTNVNEAVEAFTGHINKYDVPEEKEGK
jgi:hypothetical protein